MKDNRWSFIESADAMLSLFAVLFVGAIFVWGILFELGLVNP